MSERRGFSCALLVFLLVGVSEVRAEDPRVAVIVGANAAAAGRRPLRYAHQDAQRFAAVLEQAGRFAAADVHVLLDPEPEQLLQQLDAAARQGGLLVFYYSGHADAQALYPNGKRLELSQVRQRLEAGGSAVRVGIIDACRGGGWTQSKGLEAAPAFELPSEPTSEGSVLVSASSGLENAHEAEALQGSFFTHHLVAGLAGAADRSGEGEVTVGEAFEYARALTVRDSALISEGPQHPSFHINLRGRQDLVLTRIAESACALVLEQREGPLQVFSLPSGVRVLELTEGKRTVALSLPAGRYLVVRRSAAGPLSREVSVVPSHTARILEDSLELSAPQNLASKRFEQLPPSLTSTVPAHQVELKLGAGVIHISESVVVQGSTHFDPYAGTPVDPSRISPERVTREQGTAAITQVSAIVGLTDRLQWSVPLPALAYRFGVAGGREWIAWGGVLRWQLTTIDFAYQLGAGVDLREWVFGGQSLNFGLRGKSGGVRRFTGDGRLSPDTWIAEGVAGYSHTLGDAVTLNLSVAAAMDVTYEGRWPNPAGAVDEQGLGVGIGSVQERGLRSLPLIQVQLTEALTLDLYASIRKKLKSGDLFETYMLGLSWTW